MKVFWFALFIAISPAALAQDLILDSPSRPSTSLQINGNTENELTRNVLVNRRHRKPKPTLTPTATPDPTATPAPSPTPTPYNPRIDSSVKEWLNANDLSLADGDSVFVWTAAIGNPAVTVGSPPTFKASIRKGNSGVRFDGLNEALQTAAFSSPVSQPNEVFLVYRNFSVVETVYIFSGLTGSEEFLSVYPAENLSTMADGTSVEGAIRRIGSTDSNWHILGIRFDGNRSRFIFDGKVQSLGDPGTGGLTGLTLGSGWQGGHAQVDVGEVIIRSGSADMKTVSDYLNGHWGTYP